MWQQPVSLILYLLVAAIVVFLSIKLSNYVDLLDKKTKISGAVLGGILLAAVTSLPELFTSLTATIFISNNKYVVGNILGSDIFNITLFVIIFLLFFKKLAQTKVSKYHLVSMLFIFILYILVVIASFVFNFNNILWGWFNPISIVIVIVYAISIMKTPKFEESNDKETDSKLTVKQTIILFIIFSILLVGASIGVTYLADWVTQSFKINSTLSGAIFLGIATSLPEMTSTINLSKKKNFDAAYANLLGSCVFNFIILSLADILSFKAGPLYVIDQSLFLLIVFGIITLIIFTIALLIQIKVGIKYNKKFRILYIAFSILLIGSYSAYIILSGINLNIPFAPLR